MDKFYVKYADAMDLLMSEQPLPPTKIFDDFSVIGGIGTVMFVLETSEGLVLFDSLLPVRPFENIFLDGMKALKYDPSDVIALFVTHGHFDHTGLSDFLCDHYSIPFYMSSVDNAFSLKDNPARGFEPLHNVPTFVDEDCVICYGKKKIQIVQTPGHTPGGLSFVIPVTDDGRKLNLALWGGTSMPKEPDLKLKYRESLLHFKQFTDCYEVEAEVCAHPFMDNTHERIAMQRNRIYGMPNPFAMGRKAYLRYSDMLMEMAEENINAMRVDHQES